MSAMPGRDMLESPLPGARELACRYAVLLDLYADMETLSERIYRSMETAAPPQVITGQVREKMAVAQRILLESQGIVSLKKTLGNNGGINGEDRELIKELEERLTHAVNRMVIQEDRVRDLTLRRGVKVARR